MAVAVAAEYSERGQEVVSGRGGGRGYAWLGPAKAREASRVVRARPRHRRGREVVCGKGGGLGRVWLGPRHYRAFVGGVIIQTEWYIFGPYEVYLGLSWACPLMTSLSPLMHLYVEVFGGFGELSTYTPFW